MDPHSEKQTTSDHAVPDHVVRVTPEHPAVVLGSIAPSAWRVSTTRSRTPCSLRARMEVTFSASELRSVPARSRRFCSSRSRATVICSRIPRGHPASANARSRRVVTRLALGTVLGSGMPAPIQQVRPVNSSAIVATREHQGSRRAREPTGLQLSRELHDDVPSPRGRRRLDALRECVLDGIHGECPTQCPRFMGHRNRFRRVTLFPHRES